ncbi:hypothetical protein QTP86_024059 [Hemibagrus guttatus]|nr:hypothetical protein QTP86_024059 [Hemibagrus guttatus]
MLDGRVAVRAWSTLTLIAALCSLPPPSHAYFGRRKVGILQTGNKESWDLETGGEEYWRLETSLGNKESWDLETGGEEYWRLETSLGNKESWDLETGGEEYWRLETSLGNKESWDLETGGEEYWRLETSLGNKESWDLETGGEEYWRLETSLGNKESWDLETGGEEYWRLETSLGNKESWDLETGGEEYWRLETSLGNKESWDLETGGEEYWRLETSLGNKESWDLESRKEENKTKSLRLITKGKEEVKLTGNEPLSMLPLSFQPEEGPVRAHYKLCDRLKLEKKQRRMCRRDPGVAETLMEAISHSAQECQYQFRFERWNCTLEGRYRANILKRGFKETAFLYAISSAGLTHAMAKACSAGRMERCTCDEAPDLENRKAWQWGGCGDNLKYSNKFVKDFLGKRSNKDLRARVDMHNSHVGMKVIKSGVDTTCKCHGVSGSCTVQTCWRQLAPFHKIGMVLKQRYETALKVASATNQAKGEGEPPHTPPRTRAEPFSRTSDLLHIEDSPNFCQASMYSAGTAARKCHKDKNCDAICCGRGHNTQSRVLTRPCQCQVRWCCYVECKQCTQKEEVYTCKG